MNALPIPDLASVLGDDVATRLERAVEAALRGGGAAMAFHRSEDLDVDEVEGGPVTQADRASNRAILDVLGEDLPVRSEESDGPPRAIEAERFWVVDPLDGTREFIEGLDEFSVMVGLAEGGVAALGAVYRPVLDRLYVGVVGHGAWEIRGLGTGEERPTAEALDAERPLGDRIRLVRSRSHPDPLLARLETTLADVEVILSGSAGTKCARIAAGDADLYVHPVPHLKEWDTCAPEAVARGSGARVTDCGGGPLTYGKRDPRQPRGIFAATPEAYRSVSGAVRRIADEIPIP